MAYAMETITSTIRRYQSRIDSVKEFVKVHELPPELQRKLYDYTDAQWSQTKGFETDEMLSHLVRQEIEAHWKRAAACARRQRWAAAAHTHSACFDSSLPVIYSCSPSASRRRL